MLINYKQTSTSLDLLNTTLTKYINTKTIVSPLIDMRLFEVNIVVLISSNSSFRYEGEVNADGERHGEGYCYYPYQSKFEWCGEWKNDMWHKGIFTWTEERTHFIGTWEGDKYAGIYRNYNNGVYTGEWRHGIAHGKGKIEDSDGNWYDGEWLDDKRNGFGTAHASGEYIYEGSWVNDNAHGFGTMTYLPRGDVYVGEYKEGHRHGTGTLRMTNGDYFEGQFENQYFWSGNMSFRYHSGDVYKGEVKLGKWDGQGLYVFADGRIYEGEWKDGVEHGNGRMTYAVDEVYEGEFKNGYRDGKGKYTWANGEWFDGYWLEGKRKGFCTFRCNSGFEYTGEYENESANGWGVCSVKRKLKINQQVKETRSNISHVRKSSRAEIGVTAIGKKKPTKLDKESSKSSASSRSNTNGSVKVSLLMTNHVYERVLWW
ncbi:unnamed protein product [Didymodactylos carnosus]|uniref:MORN repeat protein n=1 Tax=Didymodactylos carnosus TaxID=1234261 RepID=A0A814HI71_9BILA|nr:unnamed protein product [Didymodactylos carnosus]CAF3781424.1 unnamed protein product [Didymodactylos carnosus]